MSTDARTLKSGLALAELEITPWPLDAPAPKAVQIQRTGKTMEVLGLSEDRRVLIVVVEEPA